MVPCVTRSASCALVAVARPPASVGDNHLSGCSYEPGPACHGHGGSRPAITDADLVLGKLDPDNFAGGAIKLDASASEQAIMRDIGERLSLDALSTAFGICEVVDENMANAARVHAVENGKNISDNLMIAFGGAAPLHAARL
jgi:N-methylhydantoinase A